jgi:ABC-2 type transport system permease protein
VSGSHPAADPEMNPEMNPELGTKIGRELSQRSGQKPGQRSGQKPGQHRSELADPAGTSGLMEVFRRKYLLKLLVRRELQVRYSGSFLGFLWSYLNPLSQFLIYYFVMGIVLNFDDRIDAFAIHMLCGIIIVHFFAETLNAGTRSIVRNRGVVQKMALPREMFPVASMLVSLYHVLPQFVILTVAALSYGWMPDVVGLAFTGLGLLVVVCMGISLALVFSVLNVYMRDITNAVNILTNLIRFGVPMIYPYTMVQDRFGDAAAYYLFNPIADAVLCVQRGFWVGATPDPAETVREHLPADLLAFSLGGLVFSLAALAIAQWIFSHFETKIPERL